MILNIDTDKLIIAGPCSAETEFQTLETAKQLVILNKVHIYRAGIWKPRTSPNDFQGIGSIGLEWLKKVKEETGLKVTTEVANTNHVEEALKAGIDILWIGSRTVSNPFAVQEIASALQGTNIPVMIKNPMFPDIKLWIGAFERMQRAGLNQLLGIFRGIYNEKCFEYRNEPLWTLAIELKSRVSVPVICDSSHICGNKNLISITQTAYDLDFDGLMIESHINPNEALSDAKQQLTPSEFDKLLSSIQIKTSHIKDQSIFNMINDLRTEIDLYDENLLNVLAGRMRVARQIGYLKKANNISIFQNDRWDTVMDNRMDLGRSKKLSRDFIENLFNLIHIESIQNQTDGKL